MRPWGISRVRDFDKLSGGHKPKRSNNPSHAVGSICIRAPRDRCHVTSERVALLSPELYRMWAGSPKCAIGRRMYRAEPPSLKKPVNKRLFYLCKVETVSEVEKL